MTQTGGQAKEQSVFGDTLIGPMPLGSGAVGAGAPHAEEVVAVVLVVVVVVVGRASKMEGRVSRVAGSCADGGRQVLTPVGYVFFWGVI